MTDTTLCQQLQHLHSCTNAQNMHNCAHTQTQHAASIYLRGSQPYTAMFETCPKLMSLLISKAANTIGLVAPTPPACHMQCSCSSCLRITAAAAAPAATLATTRTSWQQPCSALDNRACAQVPYCALSQNAIRHCCRQHHPSCNTPTDTAPSPLHLRAKLQTMA